MREKGPGFAAGVRVDERPERVALRPVGERKTNHVRCRCSLEGKWKRFGGRVHAREGEGFERSEELILCPCPCITSGPRVGCQAHVQMPHCIRVKKLSHSKADVAQQSA
eukprot:3388502-Rhodomonas_salina.2